MTDAGSHKNIAAPECSTDPVQPTENVCLPIKIFCRPHVTPPSPAHDFRRRVPSLRSALFEPPQILNGLQHRLSGRCPVELNRSEQRWKKASNSRIAARQFLIVDVLRRPD